MAKKSTLLDGVGEGRTRFPEELRKLQSFGIVE